MVIDSCQISIANLYAQEIVHQKITNADRPSALALLPWSLRFHVIDIYYGKSIAGFIKKHVLSTQVLHLNNSLTNFAYQITNQDVPMSFLCVWNRIPVCHGYTEVFHITQMCDLRYFCLLFFQCHEKREEGRKWVVELFWRNIKRFLLQKKAKANFVPQI